MYSILHQKFKQLRLCSYDDRPVSVAGVTYGTKFSALVLCAIGTHPLFRYRVSNYSSGTQMRPLHVLLMALVIGSSGCPGKVDQITTKRILPAAIHRGDIIETCQMGLSVSPIVTALGSAKRSPEKALMVTEVAGAICALEHAHTANLNEARLRSLYKGNANALPTLTDARIERERAHTDTARRFGSVWSRFQSVYPAKDGACPTLRKDDQTVYVVGVLSGLLAVLHDGMGGKTRGYLRM